MSVVDPSSVRRIAVSGASGLIGAELVAHLTRLGCRVQPLVRRTPRAGTDEVRWDPAAGAIDAEALRGIDAFVHLAGENIAGGRWTAARKSVIRESRVRGTRLVADCLARLEPRPRVLVAASAIGYYGDRGDEPVTEDSPAGEGFLAEVCRAWEDAAEPARAAGIRVVNLRIGVVLSAAGGALAKMLPAFRAGLGGRLGRGRQYMSWIGLSELVAVIAHTLTVEELSGPVNATAPHPVTNAEFTRSLGRLLHRPTVLPVPGLAVRLLLGEMGSALLLSGARVLPNRLVASGYAFRQPHLDEALADELRPAT